MTQVTTPGIDISQLSLQDLLRFERAINNELRTRNLVRTNNKPLGDIAEAVVYFARGGTLEPNSTRSHDITTKDGTRIQVKAVTQVAGKVRGQFSTFRSLEFHSAIFLIFDADDLYLVGAYEMSPEEIELNASFSQHVNGYNIRLRKVIDAGHTCLTEMQEAFGKLAFARL